MKEKKALDYKIVDSEEGLQESARALRLKRIVSVDLEADSMYHFREKVCLIQISASNLNIVMDPLKISDLSPLAPIFSSKKIRKIFHGADYDIRSLHRDFGIEVNNLFDTQIASRFVGARETGLDAVLRERFGIGLDKKFQKKDWSVRPIPEEMMEYAARDSLYLAPLAKQLEKELKNLGRLSWVKEECEILSRVRAGENGSPLYLRFRGAGHLSPRNLAILEALLQFRMKMAEKKDRPPFKIMGNQALLEIVESRPSDRAGLERSGALSKKQLQMFGKELLEVIRDAGRTPAAELPVYPRKRAPKMPPGTPERMQVLKKWRDEKAGILRLDPSIICNKAMLNLLAMENPTEEARLAEIPEMREWQRKAFGKEIIGVLAKYAGNRGKKGKKM